jgi:serine/threonine protein kinase
MCCGPATVSPASGDHSDSIAGLKTAPPGEQAAGKASQKKTASAVPENSARSAPYDILGEVGRGGMGAVFRARQKSLEREIAIKTLLSKKSEAADLHRFLAEARVTGYLDHPNIVPVHDLGVTAEGQVQMVMKLVHRAMAKINTRVFFNL